MYTYDTGYGYLVIVEDIQGRLVKSTLNLPGSKSRISLIKSDGQGKRYFTRVGRKVYLKDLEEAFI